MRSNAPPAKCWCKQNQDLDQNGNVVRSPHVRLQTLSRFFSDASSPVSPSDDWCQTKKFQYHIYSKLHCYTMDPKTPSNLARACDTMGCRTNTVISPEQPFSVFTKHALPQLPLGTGHGISKYLWAKEVQTWQCHCAHLQKDNRIVSIAISTTAKKWPAVM
jgi:hypothetical protein